MARRKRQFLDDGDDSDSPVDSDDGLADNPDDDPDVRAEKALFNDPYNRKKRRKNNDDSEDEGFGGPSRTAERRSDWTKAPSFVSGDTMNLNEATEQKSEGSESEGDDEEAESDGSSSPASKPPSPRVREEYDEDMPMPGPSGLGSRRKDADDEEVPKPRFGGLGFGKAADMAEPTTPILSPAPAPAIGRGGIGSSRRGGIGSSSISAESTLPSSFGGAPQKPQRAFIRDPNASDGSRPTTPAPLPASELLHLSKIQNTFGARMLSKMGWSAGTGLGTDGSGIAIPVESKLRPKGVGIAFKGFREKTEQSKMEARRRGEVVSDEEDRKGKKGRGKKGGEGERKEEAWKRPKRSKRKVEHKTYEQIIAEAGGEPPSSPGIGQIIDATGATPREIKSLADVSISSWTPTSDTTRIPEVRHNLRLIAESCKGDLDGLAKEAKALEGRRKWARDEDLRLRRRVDEEADLIKRLQAIHLVIEDVSSKANGLATSDYEPSLESFTPPITTLLTTYPTEYDRYRLDEIVVAAIAPIMRRMMAEWRPLEEPDMFVRTLSGWKGALKMNVVDTGPETRVDVYGTRTVVSKPQVDAPMTPYESLIWNIWLPRVRSCVNNEWNPHHPDPLVRLYEAWTDVIPPFVRDNLMDQLILPKVSSAISTWNPRKDADGEEVSLQGIVFPWLPHVGLRMEEVVEDAKRKVKSLLRGWKAGDGVPKDLIAWKDMYKPNEWDTLLVKYILPRLGSTLRSSFTINPRSQDMSPLTAVLQWGPPLFRPSTFGALLEAEFFPKWLDVLHFWLVQPKTNLEEVGQWYRFWRKDVFSEEVLGILEVGAGFERGLKLMNEAMDLGADAAAKLPKPEHKTRISYDSPQSSPPPSSTTKNKDAQRTRPSRTYEITFRSIVEDFIASHNLLFLPAGKVEEKSRLPLFRVAKTVEGKAGLLVYLLDDAVWAADADGGSDWRAISLENVVLRAMKGS
ncbi:TFP11-domain-containing protein [Rickenella mellea]|uniref:TFP11-domain-containing protein n=1 Tax=Rickenella mellea TaxID=50990 RepID=A0A4Y7Q3H3_9AGAM|nr:TFP11-domain-containing protein [Rickenella mellea]